MRFILTLAFLVTVGPVSWAAIPVAPAEQSQWIRQLLPLPKPIAIDAKIDVRSADVKLAVAVDADVAVATAAEQLRSLFKRQGSSVDKTSDRPFEIGLGVCDSQCKLDATPIPGADQLATHPNAEQAYVIRPLGDRQLVLTALDARGVYCAVQTLCQLLGNRFHAGRVTIPLAFITDWPDWAERGGWGGNAWAVENPGIWKN